VENPYERKIPEGAKMWSSMIDETIRFVNEQWMPRLSFNIAVPQASRLHTIFFAGIRRATDMFDSGAGVANMRFRVNGQLNRMSRVTMNGDAEQSTYLEDDFDVTKMDIVKVEFQVCATRVPYNRPVPVELTHPVIVCWWIDDRERRKDLLRMLVGRARDLEGRVGREAALLEDALF